MRKGFLSGLVNEAADEGAAPLRKDEKDGGVCDGRMVCVYPD